MCVFSIPTAKQATGRSSRRWRGSGSWRWWTAPTSGSSCWTGRRTLRTRGRRRTPGCFPWSRWNLWASRWTSRWHRWGSTPWSCDDDSGLSWLAVSHSKPQCWFKNCYISLDVVEILSSVSLMLCWPLLISLIIINIIRWRLFIMGCLKHVTNKP